VDAELEVGGQWVGADGSLDCRHIQLYFAGKLLGVAHVIHALVEAAAEFGGDGIDRNTMSAMAARMMSNSAGVCAASVSSLRFHR